jgi:hypothetical protein
MMWPNLGFADGLAPALRDGARPRDETARLERVVEQQIDPARKTALASSVLKVHRHLCYFSGRRPRTDGSTCDCQTLVLAVTR